MDFKERIVNDIIVVSRQVSLLNIATLYIHIPESSGLQIQRIQI